MSQIAQTVRREASRDGYGRGLMALAEAHDDVVALDADLSESTRSSWFAQKYPDRFFQMGIAEQDMIVTAAGLAHAGKVPFASSFAIFIQRGWEQVRNSIGRQKLRVKLCGSHGGLMTGQDGSSAHALEDLAIFRTVAGMAVFVPADSVEAEKGVQAMYDWKGPAYMRTTRANVPVVYDDDHHVTLGRFQTLRDGDDVALFACGPMVSNALDAAERLASEGISARVVNASSIKPVDATTVEKASFDTGCIVTCEDHFKIGGLGSAIAETLVETRPCVLERVGVGDTYTTSGTPDELFRRYHLTVGDIVQKAKFAIERTGRDVDAHGDD